MLMYSKHPEREEGKEQSCGLSPQGLRGELAIRAGPWPSPRGQPLLRDGDTLGIGRVHPALRLPPMSSPAGKQTGIEGE